MIKTWIMRNPVTALQLFAHLVRLTLDIRRLEEVIAINELLLKLASSRDREIVLAEMRSLPKGAEALRTRHRLGALDVHALSSMPSDSLGGAYGRFMVERGLSPANLPSLQTTQDIEYVLAHIYETHDLWHVLTGFDTDTRGETALQAFYMAQQRSYLPFFALAALLLNTAFFAYEQKDARMNAMTEGWRLGKRAQKLFGIDWRPHLARPLADVRREFGLERAAHEQLAVAS